MSGALAVEHGSDGMRHEVPEPRDDEDLGAFGVRLCAWRRHRKISQAGLADRTGLSFDSIRNYEAGRTEPKMFAARRIARVLDITVDQLMNEDHPGYDELVAHQAREEAEREASNVKTLRKR